jgi:hypothetical protein
MKEKDAFFCTRCSRLALAELDGVLLCTDCLCAAVCFSRDATIVERIVPLAGLECRKTVRVRGEYPGLMAMAFEAD